MLVQALSYNTQKLKAGMFYQGGIIVYVNNNTRQGLIAYNGYYGSYNSAFGPIGFYTQNSGYGFGYTNTQNAYNALSPASDTALYTVWNATFNGYSDWFLPNRVEAAYIIPFVDQFNNDPFEFWDGGTLWLSESTSQFDSYVLNRGFPPFIETRQRSQTDNRRSIACRYITFT